MDGIRIAKERRDGTLVCPCPDRSLPGHAAGDGSPCDVFIKVVRGFCGNGKILPCRHRRRLVHERLCLRVCMQYADGRADARHRAARKAAHDILHGKMVICLYLDIARRIDDRTIPDLCERAFLARTARCLRYESRAKTGLYFIQRRRVIRFDRFAGAFVDFREFPIHPAVEADGLAILARLARERLLVFRRHRAADAIDGNAAREAERANGSRNRIRHDAMHIVFRFDGHAAARCDLVSIAEEGIRLRLDISYIDGCADRRTAGAGRRGDGVLHFLDFMRRRDRDILRAVPAIAFLLVDFHARIRVRLRDRREIHHIRRAREADIGTARRLEREIEEVFYVPGIQRNLALRVQFRRLACIGFGVFCEIRHREGKTSAAAHETDGCAAVAAVELRLIRRRDGDPVCISRAGRGKLGSFSCIRMGLRIQHIHADRTIDGRGPREAARDGRIRDIRRVIRFDADILSCDLRAGIDMRLRIRAHRDGRVCQPDASCFTATETARARTLFEGGNRLYGGVARGGDTRRLPHMGIRLMRDKRLRRRASDARCTADAKTSCGCRRVAPILRLYGKALARDTCVISDIGRCLLIDHFDRCRKADAGIAAPRAAAAGRRELRRILRRHRDIAGIHELCLARVRHVFVLLITDIRFRIGGNHMKPGYASARKGVSRRDRRCNGRQVLFRLRIHFDRRSLRELRTVFDGRIGIPLVRLHVSCRADTAAAEARAQSACQTEKTRCIFRFYGDALISRLVVSLTDRCIGLLGNHIHGNRAGTGKFRFTIGKSDRHNLGCGVARLVLGRTIVHIVCFDRDAVCLDGLFLLRIAGKRRLDIRVIHHDGNRRPIGRGRNRPRADAERRVAVISGIDGERPDLHGLAACHMGIRRRMDPVPARRERPRRLIRQRAGRDDGGDLARFIRRDSDPSRLAARCARHFALFQIRLRIAFDEVHPDGRANRGRVRRHGNRARVGIDLPLVLRFDGGGFIRLHRAVLHMRVCLIVHPVQADLSRAGESRRIGTARRDVQDFRIIVCTDGERFIDVLPILVFFFIAAQGEIRPIHIGFVVRRDGVVHETPRKRLVRTRISRLELEIQRQRSRNRLDVTVIPSLHAKSICRDRGRRSAFFFRHGRLRGIGDAIHRHIRCRRESTLSFGHVILHRAIFACDGLDMGIRCLSKISCSSGT